jgi:hypothetical protein
MARDHSSSQNAKRGRTVPVSLRALEQRVARRLIIEGKGKQLKRTTGEQAIREFGRFIIVHDGTAAPVDLEKFGREIGALEIYEHLQIE